MASEIGMALFHISSFSEVCQIILDVIIKNTISQNCSIMLMDYEKDSLFLVAATDPAKIILYLMEKMYCLRKVSTTILKPARELRGMPYLKTTYHYTKHKEKFFLYYIT